ncbi:tol-pal system-associated acyl-CoA thioesterase [Neptunicella marina]|uniref:Tol-pal system-associated acyl-CoA thioesterase n=1 Tax=Neptunicella marina TaxID=2125989 RepID=A0A8J6IS08_9ALTE|nr:tol-pal system-associated acyl-CoA thioesterase [Neptunicella marina]MBC3764715.1 tol-pal system-associated acyl-CoA thioesterase [Neptunicella marina]
MRDEHEFSVRVYYEDTDAGGIVYYANYLKFLERARTEWLRELGIEQDELLTRHIGFVVRQVNMDNLRAAVFNAQLVIRSRIVQLKKASLVFHQQIFNQQNELLVDATIHIACVDLAKMRAIAIPSHIREELLRVC